jgi:hypothetical protein
MVATAMNTKAAATANAGETPPRCRVRIVNYINGRVVVIESQRERMAVWLELSELIRRVNHRRDETLRACLQLLPDEIVLSWHTPSYYGNEIVAATFESVMPFFEAEKLILHGGNKHDEREIEKEHSPGSN